MTDTFDNSKPDVGAMSGGADAPNYFDQFDNEQGNQDPGLVERARLNLVESHYRGTIDGSSDLADLARIYKLDDTGVPPDQMAQRKDLRKAYDGIVSDLARYDQIRPWGTTAEAAASASGAIAGGLTSPESYVGFAAKGVTWVGRTIRAAVQQGAIQGGIDPVVQNLNIAAGTQDKYDPTRTAAAVGMGAVIGGGLHLATGELLPAFKIKDTFRDLGTDDPSFKAGDAEPAPATDPAAEHNAAWDRLSEEHGPDFSKWPKEAQDEWKGRQAAVDEPAGQVAADGVADTGVATEPGKATQVDATDLSAIPSNADINQVRASIEQDFPDVKLDVSQRNNVLTVSRIVVPDDQRGAGTGTRLMQELLRHADESGLTVALTPDSSFGGNKNKLTAWYKSLGFVSNKGRSQDFSISESMIRPPKPPEELASISASTTDQQALAQRQSGGTLPMERARPDTGITTDPDGLTGTAVATVPEAASPQQTTAIRSLQQQAFDLADAIDFPLRQGNVKRGALGTFNTKTGVVRVKEVPDFEVVAHEAGHAIESKVGKDLTDLTNKFKSELAPMVSNPGAYDPSVHVKEGFAEFIRRYIGNPAHASQVAPGFTNAFRDFMGNKHPELLKAIDSASDAYRAYLEAPSVDVIGAVRRSRAEDLHGWHKVVDQIKTEGFPQTIKTMLQHAYTGLMDEKAPVARSVRDMLSMIKDQTGELKNLKSADNPEVLLRLFARAEHGGIADMMDGVRPYRDVNPVGPSLSDAIAKATGKPTVFGRWDKEALGTFSDYLIARRATKLWDKFARGDLPNPPTAFSRGDANVAMAELEKANPTFREASDMVHNWTRQLLKKQYDGNLIGADLYNKLAQEEFYVPFMRDLSDKPVVGGEGTRTSAYDPGKTETVKRMRGSSRDIKDPLESLMTQAFLVNRTIRHNDIMLAMENLAREAGPGAGKYFEKLPAHEAKKYTFDLAGQIEKIAKDRGVPADDIKILTGALTDVFGDDPLMGNFFRQEAAKGRGEPIVFYKRGGELQVGRLMAGEEGHALYETLTALPNSISDLGLQLLSTSSSVLRAGVTTNPIFALTNYIRDQLAAGILRSDYIPFISGLKGIRSELLQDDAAKLYAYGGGVSAGASIAPLKEAAEADLNALAKKGYLVNRLTSLHGLLELASVSEAGTRNSIFDTVYKAKIKEGLSSYEAMIEAAYSAQDMLDFSRWGSKTMAVRALTPFVNAHVQGLDKGLYRTMIEPFLRTAVTTADEQARTNAIQSITKGVAVGGALGAAWAALHHDDEIYQDASPQIKGTHFVTSMGGKLIVIPKPFELSLGFTAGEYAYQKFMKDDPRAASQFASAAFDVLKPPIPIGDNPLIKTTSELGLNRSWFSGRDIVPDRLQKLETSQQFTDRTSSMAKSIGASIGVSPIKVDYAMGAYFGLWGRDIMTLSSGVDPDAPAQSWEDTALLRRFIKDPTRSSDVTTKYWGFMGLTTGSYNQAVNTYDTLVKSFKDDDAKKFVAGLPAGQRAFVILKSGADEDGKAAFTADEKRLHPLQRAYDAVQVLNGMRSEIAGNSFKTMEGGLNIQFSPTERRDVLDAVRELAQKEMRNSFVIMKEPGYANRPLMDTDASFAKIEAASPAVAEEIRTRYATAHVYTTDAVAKAWPKLQTELLQHGSDADVKDIADDAASEGYQFGGERVKKPQKRRVTIH